MNVKQVEFTRAGRALHYLLGAARSEAAWPAAGQAAAGAESGAGRRPTPAELLARLERDKHVSIDLPDGPVMLDGEDLQVRLQAKPGWAAAQGRSCVVVLSTELTPALILEGLARELVHAIQTRRRDMTCEYTDRIEVSIETDSAELKAAIEQFREYICGETLAVNMHDNIPPGVEATELVIGEHRARLFVRSRARRTPNDTAARAQARASSLCERLAEFA